MKNVKRTQGFTLIELLIVIAIIGILAAVLIPNLLGAQKRAYDTGAQSCAKSLQTAEATYQVDKQAYFTINKANAVTGANPVSVASVPDTNGNTITATFDDLGMGSSCYTANVTIAGAATAASGTTQASYSFTVRDSRGSKSYVLTPNSLTGS